MAKKKDVVPVFVDNVEALDLADRHRHQRHRPVRENR